MERLEYKRHYDRISRRVRRWGRPLLDGAVPGWRAELEGSEVVTSDHLRCPVGLLLRGYWGGLRALSGLASSAELYDWSVRHGFDVYAEEPYWVLDRVWDNELRRGH